MLDYSTIKKSKGVHFYASNKEDAEAVLHVIKSGFKDTYYYFWEDAYETEPYRSGIKMASSAELKQEFNIDIINAENLKTA